MKTLQELDAKVVDLEQQLKEARKAADARRAEDRAAIINHINERIAEHGIAADELTFPRSTKGNKALPGKPLKVTPGKPKYRNPETGTTWTGKGMPPKWIKEAPDREVFLIKDE
ncbi:H-NS family nucleoid-associated regulatory protein [Burkholderia vietnamiensis]|uniref:H-NS histone family protein n=1 Tax=Burkholderia vietnamiensis TaxID=60552 RepID=UPI0009C065C3|nr:H-NS histone family protein [Burkholderia vietnamiensis]